MDKEDVLYHTHDGILPSRKRTEIMPFAATRMDPEIVILNAISHTEKDKCHRVTFICGTKKTEVHELLSKTKIDSQRKKTYDYQRW